jgi:hypothetical protein
MARCFAFSFNLLLKMELEAFPEWKTDGTYGVHSPSLRIGVPRLWFKHEASTGLQNVVHSSKKSRKTFISFVEVYPLGDRETSVEYPSVKTH